MPYKINKVTGEMSEYIFDFGGIVALRNFTARTSGERLIIQSATNANFAILDALVSEVEIDGVVYDTPQAAQEALQRLVFNPAVPVIMTLAERELLQGALQKGGYTGTAWDLKTLIDGKATENFVLEKIEDIKIGGRNLLKNSLHAKGSDEGGGIKYVGEITLMTQGETYIINSEIISGRTNAPYYLNTHKDWYNGTHQNVEKNTPFVANAQYKHLWVWVDSSTNQVEHKNIKLEKGNIATDWTPAPEDISVNALKRTEIDLTTLDTEKYFPMVSTPIGSTIKRTFRVEMDLYYGVHNVSWAKHPSQSFSLVCQWITNGHGWGTIYLRRIVELFDFDWCDRSPIIHLTQAGNSSQEIFYLRGGAKYIIFTDSDISVTLYPNGWQSEYNGFFPAIEYDATKVPKSDNQRIDEIAYNKQLRISNNVRTTDLINGISQHGRNIVTTGSNEITITIEDLNNFIATYQKAGTGNVTFVANGLNLIQVDGTNRIDGAIGSTATISVVDSNVLLRINNV